MASFLLFAWHFSTTSVASLTCSGLAPTASRSVWSRSMSKGTGAGSSANIDRTAWILQMRSSLCSSTDLLAVSLVSGNKTMWSKCWTEQRWEKYSFSPAKMSSEREEKEVLADSKQPTASPSTKSHATYCAERARRREKMAAVKDERFSSRFLSLLLTAAIIPICPTPLLLCSPLTHSDQVWCIQTEIVFTVHMLPIPGEQVGHINYRPVLCGFSLWLVGFPLFRLGNWFT